MNAAFFGLAGLAALNPKLLIIDLILATNQRPRLMFACFLLGGMGLAIAVGLLDVFVCTSMPSRPRITPAEASTWLWGSRCLSPARCWRPATCTSSDGAPSIGEQAAIEAGKLGSTGFA